MALRVNIKRKDPRFKGDQPRYNAVVSGPLETMDARLRRFLELQGLAPFKEEDGVSIWTNPPAIGGAPVYLVPLLKHRFGVGATREARDMAEAAFGERLAEDGLERFLGQRSGVSPGKRALTVGAAREDFVANCDADHEVRALALEAAGWLPIENPPAALAERLGTRPYRTRDPFIAGNLEGFMTERARERLKELTRTAAANIRLSKAQEAPVDFDVPVPADIDYLPFQKLGIQQIARSGKSGIIADDMGLGKAQPLDARVLTPDGWRRMGEIKVGDLVIGSDGKPTRVTGVYPQGEREVFRVTFSDGATTECCDEHLWAVNSPVRKRRGNDFRVLKLSEIRADLTDAAGNRKHYIPVVAPVEHPETLLPLDPYLLGVILGDGAVKAHYTRFSTEDSEIVESVRGSIPPGHRVVHVTKCDYAIVSRSAGVPNLVRRALINLGIAGKGSDDKFVPEIYLKGSIEQRQSILQGLLDTDGYCAKDGTIQFSSNSYWLATGVSELVMSLGGVARHTRKVSASGKDHHVVTICLPDCVTPFRLTRKSARHAPREKYKPCRGFSSVTPVGKKFVQCIAVDAPDHLYVTDDYIVTHNTVQGIGLMNAKPDAANVLVICQANMKIKWTREINKWMVNRDLTVGYAEGSEFPDTNVVVINYDILQKNIGPLHARNWDLILTDEAHNLKNEEAQRTKAVLGDLLDLDGARMLPMSDRGQLVHLTGTPKPNRVSELWPLLTSSRPDLWGRGPKAREIFLNRYQPPFLIKKKMRRGNREVEMIIPMDGKPLRETELQLRLRGSGSFIRRLKRDTDLPPKFRTPLEIPARLTKEDKALLREAEADLEAIVAQVSRTEMRVGDSVEAGEVIKAISLIDPDTPSFNELARVRRNLGLVKSTVCANFILDELEDERDMAPENRTKTVVFAHHKEVIQRILAEAETRMPGTFLVYDGSVKPSERQAIIDRFQEDEQIRGIIISLAGATGITLTASARMRVVEPDWTPSNMIQIEDRIWRIGQERNVDIGYLSVAGTLDARIGNALVEKMESDEKAINTIRFKHGTPGAQVRKRAEPAPPPNEQTPAQPELPF
jgi:hypothetical protein